MTDNDKMIESLLEKFENENKDQLKLSRKLYEKKLARRKIINEKKQKEQRKKYAEKTKFKKYNLTLEKYNKMLKEQNNCCAICKTHKSMFKKSFSIDHCHKTGKIRGLLCNRCNPMLGYAQDRTDILQEAINYLNKKKKS